MSVEKRFKIGDFCFSLTYPERITPPENFLVFESPEVTPEYAYSITLADCLPLPEGKCIAERADIRIYQNGSLESRLLGVKGRESFYACYRETSDSSAQVLLVESGIRDLNIDPIFTSLLALERRLIGKGGLVLHCAYTKYRGEAILFSAPSETGKTTQANLWGKYRGSETVNGDRSLLQVVSGRWTAQGWPVCGTSEICHNEAVPIRAIVMLNQAKEDTVRRLSPMEAFPQLYSQITVNTWNRGYVAQDMSLIDSLVSQVPLYHLACTISENAVACLENAIYGGDAV